MLWPLKRKVDPYMVFLSTKSLTLEQYCISSLSISLKRPQMRSVFTEGLFISLTRTLKISSRCLLYQRMTHTSSFAFKSFMHLITSFCLFCLLSMLSSYFFFICIIFINASITLFNLYLNSSDASCWTTSNHSFIIVFKSPYSSKGSFSNFSI